MFIELGIKLVFLTNSGVGRDLAVDGAPVFESFLPQHDMDREREGGREEGGGRGGGSMY